MDKLILALPYLATQELHRCIVTSATKLIVDARKREIVRARSTNHDFGCVRCRRDAPAYLVDGHTECVECVYRRIHAKCDGCYRVRYVTGSPMLCNDCVLRCTLPCNIYNRRCPKYLMVPEYNGTRYDYVCVLHTPRYSINHNMALDWCQTLCRKTITGGSCRNCGRHTLNDHMSGEPICEQCLADTSYYSHDGEHARTMTVFLAHINQRMRVHKYQQSYVLKPTTVAFYVIIQIVLIGAIIFIGLQASR